MKIHPVTADV